MNSKHLKIFLASILIFLAIISAGCGSATQDPNTENTATSPAISTPAEFVATVTEIPPTATPEPTWTDIPPTNTPEPTATPQPTVLPNEIQDSKDVPMVLVPAGEFVMGANDDQAAAMPAHTVYLDAYYIDVYEVTQNRYRECLEAGGCDTENGKHLNTPVWDEHPMMDINWYDAQEYCEWRGGNLPTEAQWEKAARGTDQRRYPWGNEPVTCELARYGECGWMTAPVGSHPAGVSPYGVHDMAGNAWEFVYDWYDRDYYKVSPSENPTGPDRDTGWKSERGGAWFYEASLMSSIWRNHAKPTWHFDYVGFRCVINP
jgi:formylglycine-generating enzyme required for sulfatase activity